jgi:hypothetical protein
MQCYPSIQLNAKLTHISAGIGFWTHVDWDIFAHLSEYYTPFKPVTFFFNTLYIQLDGYLSTCYFHMS